MQPSARESDFAMIFSRAIGYDFPFGLIFPFPPVDPRGSRLEGPAPFSWRHG